MRIGIFGGTFNPPHLGHRHIAEDFATQMAAAGLPLDRVLIIPSNIPPHKAAPDLASNEDRLTMCKLQFEGDSPVSHTPFQVSDIETKRDGASYTYQTLEELQAQYPDADLYFLMGDDMLLYFPHWKEPERILNTATLVSTIRSNACTVEQLRTFAKETYPTQYEQNRFLFFESDPFPVSSTEVRELVRAAQPAAPAGADPSGTDPNIAALNTLTHLLDPRVLQHILKRGLYQ